MKWLAMSSATGVGLTVVSTLLMAWVSFFTGKPLPDGLVTIVGIIFAGKTAHGVMTAQYTGRKDGTLGSQD